MTKFQETAEPLKSEAAAIVKLPFEHCDFNTAQLQQIFGCGKTTLFQEIIPQLEVYYEGSRLKATGRSIIKYRERKLAEPRASRPMPKNHHQKKRRSRESGSAP